MKYLLGMDIGTTSLKAVLFDENANPVKSTVRDYTLEVKGDRVEFPAESYWEMALSALNELRAEYDIYAMSIDTQCETLIVTDENGTPLDKAIVWLDNRATAEADKIREAFGEEKVYEVTGQPEVNATWPASKLLWLKDNKPEVFGKVKKIFLLEDYLLYRLTGRFVTERTLQSSTIYLDIVHKTWWRDMLDFIGVSESQLPELLDSGIVVGEYEGIKVTTGAMDQVAGAIGAGIVRKGIISEMTGTTMVVFAPADEMPPYSHESKIPCHMNYDGNYALLMWTPTAGIALKWFKNQFCESFSFRELDDLARDLPAGSDGLTFLPYLCGSTMPKYNPAARGSFTGLTTEHGRAHFVRSVMESVSCMLKANLDYLALDVEEIRAMGGGATSPLWCQMKADMTKKRLVTLKNKETACLGAAILAGVGAGIFKNVSEATAKIEIDKSYTPKGADYTECYERFKAYDKILNV